MEAGKISIIIPTYNHARYVVEAVESALAQTYRCREVIVVDDGSTDNTREVLEPYLGRLTYIFQLNQGLSAARNTGIRAACGEFIAILDADDSWLPQKLEVQVELFRRTPDLGLVSCWFIEVDAMGAPIAPGVAKGGQPFRFRELLKSNCVSGGSSAVIRRTCLDRVGLFDEGLKAAEDWDMWFRIAARYPIQISPECLTRIRVSPNSMSAAVNAGKMLANELIVLRKLFSDTAPEVNAYHRGMAFSCRYAAVARAYYANGSVSDARLALSHAFLSNPLWFMLQRKNWVLTARLMVARCRSEASR